MGNSEGRDIVRQPSMMHYSVWEPEQENILLKVEKFASEHEVLDYIPLFY